MPESDYSRPTSPGLRALHDRYIGDDPARIASYQAALEEAREEMDMTARTTVISVRGRKAAELLADPAFQYVGRAVHRQGWRASAFGNPYRSEDCGRTDNGSGQRHAAALFEKRLMEIIEGRPCYARTDEMEAHFRQIVANLPSLRGKTLGCWCCKWSPGEPIVTPCHAIVLSQLADSTIEEQCRNA